MVGNYSKPSNWMGFLGLERSKTTQIFLHMFVSHGCNAPRNLKVQIVQDISSLLSLTHCNFKQNSLNYINELPYLDLPQVWPLECLGSWGWISHSLIIIRELLIFTLVILLALSCLIPIDPIPTYTPLLSYYHGFTYHIKEAD